MCSYGRAFAISIQNFLQYQLNDFLELNKRQVNDTKRQKKKKTLLIMKPPIFYTCKMVSLPLLSNTNDNAAEAGPQMILNKS